MPERAPLIAAFGAELEAIGGHLHEAASLEEARALARELVAGASVARWRDPELDGIAELEADPAAAEVSLIRADVAVAETGAIGFAHGPGRPRAAGLLPTRQIALLAAGDLVRTLAEALARLNAGGAPPTNVVLAAGPSRTSDIEQRSIRGVHSPRELDVIMFGP